MQRKTMLVICGVLVAAGGLEWWREERANERHREEERREWQRERQQQDVAPSQAPIDAKPRTPLDFPLYRVDAAKIINKSRSEVVKELGEPQADADNVHELPGGGKVGILYDKDRAVGIEVYATETGWQKFTPEQQAYARDWFRVAADSKVNDVPVVVGDSIDGLCLALYVAAWVPAQLKKHAAKQKALDARAEQERRQVEIVEAFNVMLRSTGVAATAVESDDDLILAGDDSCDTQTLRDLRKAFKALGFDPASAFKSMVCLRSTGDGATLKLR